MKTSNKVLLSILGIFVIGIAAVLFMFFKPAEVAILYIDQGEVLVDSGKGWQPAMDEMGLDEDFKIKTSADSMASIVFFESDILRLESNTEVSLNELSDTKISIKQDSGETWNKVLKLTGKETYEIETPNSVATVRGTGFSIKVGEEESVIVGDGTVNVKSKINGEVKDIVANKKAKIKAGVLEEAELDAEDIKIIEKNKDLDLRRLKSIREKIISENKIIFETVKKSQGWNDDDIRKYLDEVDRGDHNVDELAEKSPVEIKALNKLVEVTKEIQRQNKLTGSVINDERTANKIERNIKAINSTARSK